MAPLAAVSRSDNRTFLFIGVAGAKLANDLGIEGRMIRRCQEPGVMGPRVIPVLQPAKSMIHCLTHVSGRFAQQA